MLGHDLFPRDFIHLLQTPDNYVGMDNLFRDLDPDDVEEGERASRDAGIRTIDDSDDWLPVDHERTDAVGPIPETLRSALRHYLLTCAVRDLRVRAGGLPEKHIHRSMLVNVSRFTEKQNEVANQIETELESIRSQVRLYGKLAPADSAKQSAEIAALENHFADELGTCGHDWADVLSVLHDSISPIRVQPVNQKTGSKSLDYKVIKEPPGLRVIAVGGNSLSRGLTVEDLCVSYFLRNSKAYDTLLQMGRWFGYRPGYPDLCRVWMTQAAEGWYRHICLATGELKDVFRQMKRQKAPPAEFGLRVRTHPDTLLITARNKVATGVNMSVAVSDVVLSGRGIETPTLPADSRNPSNLEAIDRFVAAMSQELGAPVDSLAGNALVWTGVPAKLIVGFLDQFAVHPFNHDFQTSAIIDALNAAIDQNDKSFTNWNVAIPTGGMAGPVVFPSAPGLSITAKERRVVHSKRSPQYIMVSGKSARVGSAGDVRFGMSLEQIEKIKKEAKAEDPDLDQVSEKHFRLGMQSPLLIIYLLRGYEAVKEKGVKKPNKVPFRNGLVLPALGMHFPGATGGKTKYVVYRLNKVAQAQLEFDGDDLEEEDENVD